MPSLEHLGIAVDDPSAVANLYEQLLGVAPYKTESVREQGVRTHFISGGSTKLELLEALDDDSPVARFLERQGEGLHHIAFEVDDIRATMNRLRDAGFEPLSDAPRSGADGKEIFFLHPKQTHGVLVEFCQSTSVELEPTPIDTEDGPIAAYEAGASSAPPVLLLHGAAGCTALETRPLLRRLEPHAHVLAIDFSGHGASALPEDRFTADLFTRNARAALDHFDIDQADVFGFSMGGSMALHLAYRHPDRVRRIAVHGGCITWDEAQVEAMLQRLDADGLRNHQPQFAAQLDAAHRNWDALFDRMRSFIRTLPDRSDDLQRIASNIEHSTLVSAVDRDDLFSLDAPLGLHQTLPHSRLAVVPGERHALSFLALDAYAPLLRQHFEL